MQLEKHASLTYPNGLSPLDLFYFNQFAALVMIIGELSPMGGISFSPSLAWN
jgi:hypothetical protein